MITKIKRVLGLVKWKDSWRKDLERSVEELQSKTKIRVAVIVARESDTYSELLFLVSFLGLSLGILISLILSNSFDPQLDILAFPVLGFSAGVMTYQFRSLYISKLAPKAIKNRISLKAKSFFFDYSYKSNIPLCLIYISEMEKQSYFLALPETFTKLGLAEKEILSSLSRLILNYKLEDPIPAIAACIYELEKVLSIAFPPTKNSKEALKAYLQMPSDSPIELPTVILKGNSDIN